jgi:hypothetical protein
MSMNLLNAGGKCRPPAFLFSEKMCLQGAFFLRSHSDQGNSPDRRGVTFRESERLEQDTKDSLAVPLP